MLELSFPRQDPSLVLIVPRVDLTKRTRSVFVCLSGRRSKSSPSTEASDGDSSFLTELKEGSLLGMDFFGRVPRDFFFWGINAHVRAQYYFLLVLNCLAKEGYRVVAPFWEGELFFFLERTNSVQKFFQLTNQVACSKLVLPSEYFFFLQHVSLTSLIRALHLCYYKKHLRCWKEATPLSTLTSISKDSIYQQRYWILFLF